MVVSIQVNKSRILCTNKKVKKEAQIEWLHFKYEGRARQEKMLKTVGAFLLRMTSDERWVGRKKGVVRFQKPVSNNFFL